MLKELLIDVKTCIKMLLIICGKTGSIETNLKFIKWYKYFFWAQLGIIIIIILWLILLSIILLK
jgi:hypothetical protein